MIDAPQPSSGRSSRGFHRLAVFAACPQKYAFSEVLHLEPLECPENLAVGILVHLGLMHFNMRLFARELIRAGREDSAGELEKITEDPIEVIRCAPKRLRWKWSHAAEVVKAFMERYAEGYPGSRILDVEREYRIRLGGRLYTQRTDLTVESHEAIDLTDYKTTSGPIRDLPKWRRLDGQNLGYDLIGRLLIPEMYGASFGGVIVWMLSKTPPYDSKRLRVPIAPELRKRFARDAGAVDAAIEVVADRDPWEYERRGLFSGACQGRYGECEYRDLCEYGRPALDRYSVVVDHATELKEASGA